MHPLLEIATDRSVLLRALLTALFVGGLLAFVNQAGALPLGWKIGTTLLVPFCVSTLSSVFAIHRQRKTGQARYVLLEREIERINRFPNQNPHPVMRASDDGVLLYANDASAPVREHLGAKVGEPLAPELLQRLRAIATTSGAEPFELACGTATYALLPVAVPELGFLNIYGTDVTARKVVNKFPEQNPNPVFRLSEDGRLIYANRASAPIVAGLGWTLGTQLSSDHRAALLGQGGTAYEIAVGGKTYALHAHPIPEFSFINVYGTDVTAVKAVTKFPGQNPNPVLRIDTGGALLFANDASADVLEGLGARVGQSLAQAWLRRITEAMDKTPPEMVEVAGGGRIFVIKPVYSPEFGFINLYGTDVTAAREVERAHAENERLLLNILPASIANRLRSGESVIADRFDHIAILFADVVGFTEISSRMSPLELVGMLNEVFSIFDRLAAKHGLEKIKTIGDAYMVVEGLSDPALRHGERLAGMALDMLTHLPKLEHPKAKSLQIRIGLHTGPAVAGVIGIKKFIYDVWGDTVNTASRMESHGAPGKIHVTEAVREALQGTYTFESRGEIEVKGKGRMQTYFLLPRNG